MTDPSLDPANDPDRDPIVGVWNGLIMTALVVLAILGLIWLLS